MSDADGDPDVATLRAAREEARRTLDAQLSTLDDIDAKAVAVFRLNVALAGLLFSALSFAAGSRVAGVAALLNPATGLGVALVVLSAAAAGLTYTVAGQQVGVGPAALRELRGDGERAFLAGLVDGYADWIGYNERTNVRKALLVTLSVVGTVAGVLALGVGVLAAFTDLFVAPAVGALLVLIALGGLAGVPGQVGRLVGENAGSRPETETGTVAPQSLDGAVAGQRTFKGRDRED